MTIFVVSPTYLESVYNESKKYNFDLQGYGTFKRACRGLSLTNQADIIGFAFLGMHLPTKRSKDFQYMVQFFDLIELMNANKKFVIATDDTVAPWAKLFSKYKNIRFVKAPDYDFMSDIVINKQVFGSLLLDTSKPYFLHSSNEEPINFTAPKLEYVPLFSDAQIQCVSRAEVLDTVERTLLNDGVYQRFKTDKAYLSYFRMYYIAKLLHEEETIVTCKDAIDCILNEQQNDTANWCALLALRNYIEEITHE